MRIGFVMLIIGTIIIAFGMLFYLQGNSVVGPKSSFMYSNPKWIGYGESIAAVGCAIALTGVVISLRRPRS